MISLLSTFISDAVKCEAWRFWDIRDTFKLFRTHRNIQVAYIMARIEMDIYLYDRRPKK